MWVQQGDLFSDEVRRQRKWVPNPHSRHGRLTRHLFLWFAWHKPICESRNRSGGAWNYRRVTRVRVPSGLRSRLRELLSWYGRKNAPTYEIETAQEWVTKCAGHGDVRHRDWREEETAFYRQYKVPRKQKQQLKTMTFTRKKKKRNCTLREWLFWF